MKGRATAIDFPMHRKAALNKFNMGAASVALMVSVCTASAAEWAHCYTGEAPADAKLWSTLPPPAETFAEYIGIASIRHACGADTTVDRKLLEQELANAECSETSELAEYAGTLMSTPVEVISAQYAQSLKTDADGFAAFCASLAACEPTEDAGYGDDCEDALKKAIGG